MSSARDTLPTRLTENHPATIGRDTDREYGLYTPGLEVSRQVMAHLAYSEVEQDLKGRLFELEDHDELAAESYRMRRQGMRVDDIALKHRCSRATIYRALERAHAYVETYFDALEAVAQTPEARLDLLRRRGGRDGRAWYAAMMSGWGFSQERIAEFLDISDRTVREDVRRVKQFVGQPVTFRMLQCYAERVQRESDAARAHEFAGVIKAERRLKEAEVA